MDAMYTQMLPAPAGVVPAIRLTMNAGYYLDVSTPNWATNRGKFPGLSNQYKALIEAVVQDATSRGIVVILDLHWNDDVTEQQEMALKGSGNANTGDSLTFWDTLSKKFGSNPLVWYELYNEPHAASIDVWLNGNTKFEGMKAMAATVRANSVKGMILVAGAFAFAYDATSLLQFAKDAPVDQIAFVFHP
jgi:aryl-phospho-beta-D-glucosidase BglC (GH1 family)